MGKIGITQNYSSPPGATGVGNLTDVSKNKGQDSTGVQQGQSWYNRLSSWVQGGAQSLYSTLQQNAPAHKTAWENLSQDSGGGQGIAADKKTFPEMKIAQWDKKEAPVQESRVVQLLRKLEAGSNALRANIPAPFGGDSAEVQGQPFEGHIPQTLEPEHILTETEHPDGETVMVDVIKLVADSDLPSKELNAVQMDDLADAMKEDVPIPQKTAARPDVEVTTHSNKSETPKLDEVAEKWLADNNDWTQPEIYEAAQEKMNEVGMSTTPSFRSKTNEKTAERNKNTAASGIMTEFFKEIEGKNPKEMAPADFKDAFRKAVVSYTFSKEEWFQHIGSELVDAGWDPAN